MKADDERVQSETHGMTAKLRTEYCSERRARGTKKVVRLEYKCPIFPGKTFV